MELFGGLPGFAGGPTLPTPAPEATVPTPAPALPAPEPFEDFEVTGDIRDHSWDTLPIARPGHATSLWGNPERSAALFGTIAAADPVLGADPAEAGAARIETQTTYHEIEIHSTAEYSTSLTIEIKARP
ncbi:hypothetical protein ACFROC_18065 [Nocardia tengchongensis]|uniref:hypothetical protein n=1 Tax=Nocardia tengchongensis TaxID=2055889 RepID=UPI003697A4FF